MSREDHKIVCGKFVPNYASSNTVCGSTATVFMLGKNYKQLINMHLIPIAMFRNQQVNTMQDS